MLRQSATEGLKVRNRFKRHLNYEENLFGFMRMTNGYFDRLTKRIDCIEIEDENLDMNLVDIEDYEEDILDFKACIYYGLYLSFFSYIEMKLDKVNRNTTLFNFIDENFERLIENKKIHVKYKNNKELFLETFSFFNRIRSIIAHSNGYYDKDRDEIKKASTLEKWKEEIPELIEKKDGIEIDYITSQIHVNDDFVRAFWNLFYDEY